jgi:hypothetical protein
MLFGRVCDIMLLEQDGGGEEAGAWGNGRSTGRLLSCPFCGL